MGMIKRWNGGSWQDYRPKRWNGSSWVDAVVRRWNGSSWQTISSQQFTKTWEATWTRSFGGDNQYKGSQWGGERLYQGRYGAPDSNQYDWGIQKSMCGFNYTDIQNNLRGARIDKVEIYLRNQHFWYYAGGAAYIGTHNATGAPWTFNQNRYGLVYQNFQGRGQGRWITMPINFGEALRDGREKGFTLYRNSHELSYYGYWYGADSGGNKPKIRVTYTK